MITTGWLKNITSKLDYVWHSQHSMDVWNGQWPDTVTDRSLRISLCTTCMDRLDDLKLTLPKNIEDNKDYWNVEFVLLDYNSRKDDVGGWVQKHFSKHIEKGLLVYYRTEEPKYYTMSHSRNVAFKLATGDIVNNVDSDSFTNEEFAKYLNKLAMVQPEKACFAKGKKMTRGRLGFYRKEFIELLGGYDESMFGYGHDEKDLMYRAMALGFKLMHFGGKYFAKTDIRPNKVANYEDGNTKNWRYTEQTNKLISYTNLLAGVYKANEGKHWGKAKVTRNFTEVIEI